MSRRSSLLATAAGAGLFAAGIVQARRLAAGDDADTRRAAATTGPIRALAGTAMLLRPDLLADLLAVDAPPTDTARVTARMLGVRELVLGVATTTAARSSAAPGSWLLALSVIDGLESIVVLEAAGHGSVHTIRGLAFAAADLGSAATAVALRRSSR